jgi:hypothetical protein
MASKFVLAFDMGSFRELEQWSKLVYPQWLFVQAVIYIILHLVLGLHHHPR